MKLDHMSKYDQPVLSFQWGNLPQDFTRIGQPMCEFVQCKTSSAISPQYY